MQSTYFSASIGGVLIGTDVSKGLNLQLQSSNQSHNCVLFCFVFFFFKSLAVCVKLSLVWIGAGCCEVPYRQANNEDMIPHFTSAVKGLNKVEKQAKTTAEEKNNGAE